MFSEYPELRDRPELSELSDGFLRYAWYMRCEDSPIIDFPPDERVAAAIRMGFVAKTPSPATLARLREEDYTDSEKEALQFFAEIRAGMRRQTIQSLIAAWENTIDMLKTKPRDEAPMSEKQAYASMVFSSSDKLAELINKIEHGYGVKAAKVKKSGGVNARPITNHANRVREDAKDGKSN